MVKYEILYQEADNREILGDIRMHTVKKRSLIKLTAALLTAVFLLSALLPVCADAAGTGEKTVRVGYVQSDSYEEIHEDGYMSGSGYEYLQEISYITGWNYEYVFASFSECYDMLVNGEIDLLGDVTYTTERAELVDFSAYPQGKETYWLCTDINHTVLTSGKLELFNNCRIGVLQGSYQHRLLKEWLAKNNIDAQIFLYRSYDDLPLALGNGVVDAIVTQDYSVLNTFTPIMVLGSSEYYFAVSKQRPDLLDALNMALGEIQLSDPDFNSALAHKYRIRLKSSMELNTIERQWLVAHDNTLRLGLLADSLPYSKQGEDGSASGILSALADNLTQEFGVKVKIRFYPDNTELTAGLERGEVDAIGPVYNDYYFAEKSNNLLTNEVISGTLVAIYNKDDFDVNSGIVAVSNDVLMTERVTRMLFPSAELLLCGGQEACLNAVISGKADFALGSSMRLNLLRQYPAMQELQFADLPLSVSVALSTTRDNTIAVSILNKGIALSETLLSGSLLVQNSYVQAKPTLREFFRNNIVMTLTFGGTFILVLLVMAVLLYQKNKQTTYALEKARKASTAKTEFLSRMSHDIRTPMNAIINLTNLARREDDIMVVHDYLYKVSVSSDFLLGLINDILDLSKIESGELTLHEVPMTNEDFYASINTVIRPLMDARHINFHCDIIAGDVPIMVDRLRFNQIFFNLLSNAAKFTPMGGDVWFDLHCDAIEKDTLKMRFTVRDNGIGMSEEFLQHLYDPFAQEHSQLNDKTKGTGLGLPIVKSLVEAMGGTISVKSKLGAGTEFVVTMYAGIAKESEKPGTAEEEKATLTGLRILLVEDNEINTYVGKLVLEEAGCIVETASNGIAAVDIFKTSKPFSIDAILMDVRMPVMDGLEATRAIRALKRYDAATVPIIAMTADAFTEESKRTIDAGMNAHLSKPLEPELLYSTLAKYTRKTVDCSPPPRGSQRRAAEKKRRL